MLNHLLSPDTIRYFIRDSLLRCGSELDDAIGVADGLLNASLRGVDSHGIRLFPHYLRALQAGRISVHPHYVFTKDTSSSLLLDADHAFGLAAGRRAVQRIIEVAAETGIAMVGVKNSSHCGAMASSVLEIADHHMIGLGFTNASPLMRPYNGVRAFFGANPLCFVAPMADEPPFCLDMSTTQVTWNRVKLAKERGEQIPSDVAYDSSGSFTSNPHEAVSLAPIGMYKGYGLSIMIDILCSILTGMPSGDKVSDMYGNDLSSPRFLGQCYVAINIQSYIDVGVFEKRLQELANAVRSEPRAIREQAILFPGDPEKIIAEKRSKEGIPIEEELLREFDLISRELRTTKILEV
jgi:ureidoglycolate dehydrogenase (NAD+)